MENDYGCKTGSIIMGTLHFTGLAVPGGSGRRDEPPLPTGLLGNSMTSSTAKSKLCVFFTLAHVHI
ncbi:MAG: hypothetical protein MI861_04540, partial [Pirellulales bacterium]|nr:hypothetical protein [Pirellulales bacterium]